MPEIDYHVPTNPKKPKLGIMIVASLNILNTSLFGIGFFSLKVGTCDFDREGICISMIFLGLIMSVIFSLALLVIGFILIKQTSPLMRWIMLGLPTIELVVGTIWLLSIMV
ncbi:hypothetical protein [Herpetosiphon geysericola]|uniref:Uncharacterized protein n=1 Tax=Herpetosiphon geysericola TaxID=70996 RepID=A0A0N8GRC5_9CHLR|nr:hypothetical protein [Herpetosiphon geysericola]KPL86114.1 hypothetical protein SE18_14695 [Herpetosiphon geysericola]